jgi:hypothetical protein
MDEIPRLSEAHQIPTYICNPLYRCHEASPIRMDDTLIRWVELMPQYLMEDVSHGGLYRPEIILPSRL